MLTRVASTPNPHPPPIPLHRFTWHLIAGCRLCLRHFLQVHPSLHSPHLQSCLSGEYLFLRQAPATPYWVAFTRDLDSPCICPTINKTSQSWQINFLVNGTQPPGFSLLLMSRLLRSFLHSSILLPSLSPSLPSDWKEASGCRSSTIEALRGACDIQSSSAQMDEDKYSAVEDLLIINKCCGRQLGGPSSSWKGDESLNVMRVTDQVKSTLVYIVYGFGGGLYVGRHKG